MIGFKEYPPLDIETLHLASMDETSPAQCRENILIARARIGDFILNTDSTVDLKRMAECVLQIFKKYPESGTSKLIEQFNQDAILRLSMVNSDLALMSFKLLLSPLGVEQKKWLSFTLTLEKVIKNIRLNHETFVGPQIGDPYQPHSAYLVMLYQQWPQLREQFKGLLEQNQMQADQLLQEEVQQCFAPFVSNFFPIRPGESLEIQQAIAQCSPEMIGWLTVNIYALEPKTFQSIAPSSEALVFMGSLINRFGREKLLFGLNERSPQPIAVAAKASVEQDYDAIINGLTFNARRWLFLTLLLEDHTAFIPRNITMPTGVELQVCQRLQAVAYECPTITRLLHQRLVSRLGSEEDEELFKIIRDYIQYAANTLPDQMRLWLSLSLATHSQPQFFPLLAHSIHENNRGPVIYQTLYTPLTPLFHRLAHYSNYVRQVINKALLTKTEPDKIFDQNALQLPLYQSHYFNTDLKAFDKNALCWLYLALITNMHLQQPTPLSPDFTIIKPHDRTLQHAQQILDIAYANPTITKQIIKEIEILVPVDNMRMLRRFSLHFLQAKLNKISDEAKKWLYWSLRSLTVHNTFQVDSLQTLSLPDDAKMDVAKIFYMLMNNPELIVEAREYLQTKCPACAQLHPEADQFGYFAVHQLAPGELCYQTSLSEEASLQLLPTLMSSVTKTTKQWLSKALTSGEVNAYKLVEALPKEDDHITDEMGTVPNILILAMKWPSVRARIVKECGGDVNQLQDFSMLILDGFRFGEKGMMALMLGLKNKCHKLTHFSAARTSLTDTSLRAIADCIIGSSPLKVFYCHLNPQVSAQGLQALLRTGRKRLTPFQQPMLVSAVLNFVKDPDVFSLLYATLAFGQHPLFASHVAKTHLFYTPEQLKDKIMIADLLLQHAKLHPVIQQSLLQLLSVINPSVCRNNQLVFAATRSHDAHYIHLTMQEVLGRHQSERFRNWLKMVITQGKIVLNPDDIANDEDSIRMIQMSCLFLVSSKVQRFALAQYLGMNIGTQLPEITQLSMRHVSLNPILSKTLINAIGHTESPLKDINLDNDQLDDDAITSLCTNIAKKHAGTVKSLSLNHNIMGEHSVAAVTELLSKTAKLEHVEINGHQAQPQVLKVLLEKLKHNQTLTYFDATPLYLSNPHFVNPDDMPGEHLCRLARRSISEMEEVVKVNAAHKSNINKLRRLAISERDQEETHLGSIKRSASSPAFEFEQEQPVLRFSKASKIRAPASTQPAALTGQSERRILNRSQH